MRFSGVVNTLLKAYFLLERPGKGARPLFSFK